jgi:alpha-1,2-mannosyltransferase
VSEALESLAHAGRRSLTRPSLVRLASTFFCAVVPAVVVATLFFETMLDDAVAFDFRVFYAAAEAFLRGESPYVSPDDPNAVFGRSYVYPPLTAILVAPLTVLPEEAAGVLVMACLVVAAVAVPWVLGVRDWRCYGVMLLWPSVLSAVQTATVTIPLALAAALAWRYRNSTAGSAAAVGASLAAKTILWPLGVWLLATRRVVAAVLAVAVGVVLVVGSWAVVGFDGMASYPELLRKLEGAVGKDSYTAYIVALDVGAPTALARALWLGLGIAILAAVVAAGRRGDERTSFVLAVVASLALTPIVWLHYFALLVVPVALVRQRLGVVWFVPLLMVVTPGSGQPTPFETAWTLGVAAATVALCLRGARDRMSNAVPSTLSAT